MRTDEDTSLAPNASRATHYAIVHYADSMQDGVVQSAVVSVRAWDDGGYPRDAAQVSRDRSLGICNVPAATKVGDVLSLRPWG